MYTLNIKKHKLKHWGKCLYKIEKLIWCSATLSFKNIAPQVSKTLENVYKFCHPAAFNINHRKWTWQASKFQYTTQ